eukprot:1668929-Rhodomonas_salina.1
MYKGTHTSGSYPPGLGCHALVRASRTLASLRCPWPRTASWSWPAHWREREKEKDRARERQKEPEKDRKTETH